MRGVLVRVRDVGLVLLLVGLCLLLTSFTLSEQVFDEIEELLSSQGTNPDKIGDNADNFEIDGDAGDDEYEMFGPSEEETEAGDDAADSGPGFDLEPDENESSGEIDEDPNPGETSEEGVSESDSEAGDETDERVEETDEDATEGDKTEDGLLDDSASDSDKVFESVSEWNDVMEFMLYSVGSSSVSDPESFLDRSSIPSAQVTQRPSDQIYIEIKQGLFSFSSGSLPITSVYRVDARLDGELIYSNVFAIDVTDANDYADKTIQIFDLPAGCDVEVSLLYPGAEYALYSGWEDKILIEDIQEQTAYSVLFGLYYTFKYNFDHGLTNTFCLAAYAEMPEEPGPKLPSTGGHGAGVCLIAGGILLTTGWQVWKRQTGGMMR